MNGDIRQLKRGLRRQLAARRDSVPEDERREMSRLICSRLLSLESFGESAAVFCFVSAKSEPETRPFIEASLSAGKKTACPRCTGKDGLMDFYYITCLSQLVPGSFGIYEPDASVCVRACAPFDGLCVVPALAFDLHGGRLGYGGGYYDRFLGRFGGTAVGICFDDFVSDETLPSEPTDRRVQYVVTEKRVISCV